MTSARTLLLANVLLDVLHTPKTAPAPANVKESADMNDDPGEQTPPPESPPAAAPEAGAPAPDPAAAVNPAPDAPATPDAPAPDSAPTPAPAQKTSDALAILQAAAQLAQFLSQNKDVLAFMSTLTGTAPRTATGTTAGTASTPTPPA